MLADCIYNDGEDEDSFTYRVVNFALTDTEHAVFVPPVAARAPPAEPGSVAIGSRITVSRDIKTHILKTGVSFSEEWRARIASRLSMQNLMIRFFLGFISFSSSSLHNSSSVFSTAGASISGSGVPCVRTSAGNQEV